MLLVVVYLGREQETDVSRIDDKMALLAGSKLEDSHLFQYGWLVTLPTNLSDKPYTKQQPLLEKIAHWGTNPAPFDEWCQ